MGAIFAAAAGEQLFEACRLLGGCTTGNVKPTPGFCLLARYIFHAVGPTRDEPFELLASCYRKCFDLAASMEQRSIAFPCVSTDIYGMDPDLAADIALRAVCDWLHQGDNMTLMDRIIFVFFRRAEESLYIDRWAQFVEAPPPVMIRRIATAALLPDYPQYTDRAITCGRPSCQPNVPARAAPASGVMPSALTTPVVPSTPIVSSPEPLLPLPH